MKLLYRKRSQSWNLLRRLRKFFYLERVTIVGVQGTSEDKKFAAKPTRGNSNLVVVFGITILICLFSIICLQATETEYQFKGNHFLASYMKCDHDALIDLPALREAMLSAAEKSGATVLDSVKYEFTGDGFTMVILLSESHASIHTYPEVDACFVDLFTCGDNCSSENFDDALRAYLKPEKVSSRNLIRAAEIEDALKGVY